MPRHRPLYASTFLLALALELYGTWLGNWTWAREVPVDRARHDQPAGHRERFLRGARRARRVHRARARTPLQRRAAGRRGRICCMSRAALSALVVAAVLAGCGRSGFFRSGAPAGPYFSTKLCGVDLDGKTKDVHLRIELAVAKRCRAARSSKSSSRIPSSAACRSSSAAPFRERANAPVRLAAGDGRAAARLRDRDARLRIRREEAGARPAHAGVPVARRPARARSAVPLMGRTPESRRKAVTEENPGFPLRVRERALRARSVPRGSPVRSAPPVGEPPAGSTLIASFAPGTRRFECAGATGTRASRLPSTASDSGAPPSAGISHSS